MPAITADTLTLPRIAAATLGDTERPVKQVTTGPQGFEGEGFPVVRAFAGVSTRDLDPFIHMDQMGEVDYAPGEPKGTAWHPHRGFETVTYMIDGTFQHQDSHGGGGVINNGATQWMTAGAGHPAHRDAAGGAGAVRRAVPRPAAVGQPAGEGQVQRPALPGDRGRRRRRWSARPTAARSCASSPARSTATPVRARRTRRSPWRTRPCSPARSCRCRGSRSTTRSSTCCPARGTVGAEQRPIHQGQLAVFGAGDRLTIAADSHAGLEPAGARGRAARRPSDQRAGRALRAVRDEHQGRADPGDRGLPGRPPRRHPGERAHAAHLELSQSISV